MIGDKQLPMFRMVEKDPDSIPRGFIDTEPDMLNVKQQKKLTEMKVKMIDFNEEYIANHPQLEALVRLLISELIIHKPYYVRDFIKEILSRENLEEQIAMIIAEKKLNLKMRHSQQWEVETADEDEQEVLSEPEDPHCPEPCLYRKETRPDKREYFKIPYVFYPAESSKPNLTQLEKNEYLQFYCKSCNESVLDENSILPTTNYYTDTEETITNYINNKELRKICKHCRTHKLKNYLNATNKNNLKLKENPYRLIADKISVPDKILKKSIQAIRKEYIKKT